MSAETQTPQELAACRRGSELLENPKPAQAGLTADGGLPQREEPSGLCLAGIAANKACRPDDTLKRCTICGFVVDTQYATEKPTTHLRPTGGHQASGHR